MKIKVVFASWLVLLLLSAFVPHPAPLFAVALPEGRTLDEGHDSGYIDWSGGVNYADLFHRDGICPSGCTENVTQISSGGMVSGAFAGDVSYFEVMLAYSGAGGFGTATIQACSSSYSVYLGVGGATPGFNSFPLSVPSGCTSWSVSASGGVLYFRSVDANYSYIPPTSTFTPSPTPTETETPTPTPTETLTPTATETEAPTPPPTSTETLTPPPSDTPTPSNTPIPSSNNDDDSDSSSSNSGWQFPVIPFAWFPSATPNPTFTPLLSIQVAPTSISQTSTPVHAPTSTSITPLPLPTDVLACTPSAGSDFPWWILPAGMTIASALSLLSSFLKNLDTASITLGDLSFSPFGVTVPVRHRVLRTTTVGEWVMRPIRTMVSVMRTIWRTVTEAVARFISVPRKIIDQIIHSEWVTTFKQVAKTFWEKVTEKAPLLGWLGKVIGFIWKTVVKPVIRWITEAVRTLRTWVENVVRWVVEKIQDGWNYITRQVSETVREWVEKTDWVRDWVTKEITVWETVWEKKFYPFPMPLGGGGSKLAIPAQQTWSKVLRTLGIGTAVATVSVIANMCTNPLSPLCAPSASTPTLSATEAFNVALTSAWGTSIANSQTAQAAFTPAPMSTATSTPLTLPAMTYEVKENDNCQAIAASNGISLTQLYDANPTIRTSDPTVCNIHVKDILTIPEQVIRTPAENIALYNCAGTPPKNAGDVCLSPIDSADTMLTHVLFGEGGSTIGASASANEMYVLINRANQILRAHGIEPTDPNAITDEQYKQFLVQVASQTYYDGAGNAYPAFNAFDAPVAHPKEGESGYDNWNSAAAIVSAAITSRGQTWIFDSRNDNDSLNDAIGKPVIAYCAPAPGSPEPNSLDSKVYFESRDYNSDLNQYQFYFSYQQFYNGGGKEYCEQYANYK